MAHHAPPPAALLASMLLAGLILLPGSGSKADAPASPGMAISGLPLDVVTDLPLPGGTTRLDYQDVDPARRRLYVAHLGDGTVHVVDLDRLSVVRTIDGVTGVHGVRVAPDRHRLYASATSDDQLVTIDLTTRQVNAHAEVGATPDVLAYDSGLYRLYVAAEDGTVAVFDTRDGRPKAYGRARLAPDAHTVAVDPRTRHVLFPLADIDGHPTLRVTTPS